MAKGKKTIYFCQECGNESSKWLGQCPACGAWNSFVEEIVRETNKGKAAIGKAARAPVTLAAIDTNDEARIMIKIKELDRVLGGGIVKGSLVLIGGDPGIGKSTLLLQMCRLLALEGKKVLYVSGEESLRQIRMRAERIGTFNEKLFLLCETSMEDIRIEAEKMKPDVMIVDSIQTMVNDQVSSAPGSVSQVRESTAALLQIAKGMGISVFIVGHVTKDGSVAGPRVLEHMVDTVLYFEGDRHASYRVLRGVKNRFGSTDEIGVFEMGSDGLREVANPSQFMLEGKPQGASGSIVSCSMEGSRPILVEVQALVCRSNFGLPRRTATGTDYNRVNLLLAVLEKRGGLHMSDHDVYVNIAGGIRMTEPAIDLAILLAVASSYLDLVIPDALLAIGEVGLSGEIRAVAMMPQRVQEAKKMGFTTVILPKVTMAAVKDIEGIEIIYAGTIGDALQAVR